MTETFEQCSMNFSVVPICNAPLNLTSLSTADYFNSSAVLRWLISRLRIFLYLSNPYEESFQHENEIADYHTEVLYNATNTNIRKCIITEIIFETLKLYFHILYCHYANSLKLLFYIFFRHFHYWSFSYFSNGLFFI